MRIRTSYVTGTTRPTKTKRKMSGALFRAATLALWGEVGVGILIQRWLPDAALSARPAMSSAAFAPDKSLLFAPTLSAWALPLVQLSKR